MKTDRELLELAARAYGLGKEWFYCEHGNSGAGMYRVDGSSLSYWSSAKDAGDAMRLAVKLKFDILHNEPFDTRPAWVAAVGCRSDTQDVHDESFREAATFRALTRAAAQMQLNKEKNK